MFIETFNLIPMSTIATNIFKRQWDLLLFNVERFSLTMVMSLIVTQTKWILSYNNNERVTRSSNWTPAFRNTSNIQMFTALTTRLNSNKLSHFKGLLSHFTWGSGWIGVYSVFSNSKPFFSILLNVCIFFSTIYIYAILVK